MTTQQPEALRLADNLEANRCHQAARELRRLHAENEALKKQMAAAPQAVQAAVPEAIEQMAVDRYKVVPSHESMFHRWAVVAGNGTQQLYIGREVECLNMARKFAGAFLDGAFVAMQNTAPAHPAEGVPAQSYVADFFREKGFYPSLAQAFAAGVAHAAAMPAQSVDEIMELADEYAGAQACAVTATSTEDADTTKERNALLSAIRAALAATQPAAPGMDARDAAFEAVRKAFCKVQRYSFLLDSRGNVRRCADHCGNWVEFEAVHTLFDPQSVDAALAAQAKQMGA